MFVRRPIKSRSSPITYISSYSRNIPRSGEKTSFFFADLDRDRNVLSAEAETQKRMRQAARPEPLHHEPHRIELPQIVRARLILRRVVALAPVLEVPHIADLHQIAANRR